MSKKSILFSLTMFILAIIIYNSGNKLNTTNIEKQKTIKDTSSIFFDTTFTSFAAEFKLKQLDIENLNNINDIRDRVIFLSEFINLYNTRFYIDNKDDSSKIHKFVKKYDYMLLSKDEWEK